MHRETRDASAGDGGDDEAGFEEFAERAGDAAGGGAI